VQFKDKPSYKGGYPMVSGVQENGDRPLKRENPHKYLLYKPTLSQVLVFLASGFKELPPNGALMLYISADGCFCNSKHAEDSNKLCNCLECCLQT
jgi:Protein SCAI